MYFLQDFIFCILNHHSYYLPLCCVDICWEMFKAWELFCFVIESVGGRAWILFFSPWGSGCPPILNQSFMFIHQATDLTHLCLSREEYQALTSNKMKTDRTECCLKCNQTQLADELFVLMVPDSF